jgi:hypothetical protein
MDSAVSGPPDAGDVLFEKLRTDFPGWAFEHDGQDIVATARHSVHVYRDPSADVIRFRVQLLHDQEQTGGQH